MLCEEAQYIFNEAEKGERDEELFDAAKTHVEGCAHCRPSLHAVPQTPAVIPTSKEVNGKTPRQFIFDLVATHAGISRDEITEERELNMYQAHIVGTYAAVYSRKVLVWNDHGTIGDLVRQLEAAL
jgi:hypothetical protein